MFWCCYCYEYKGPYHIWEVETKKEREKSLKQLAEVNGELKPIARDVFERREKLIDLTTIRRGRSAKFENAYKPRGTWKAVKPLYCDSGLGSIDWWRYQQEIIIGKLKPFFKEMERIRPRMMVHQDNAPVHSA
ncbi:hypothetical protein K469DRAFT_689225 [Zopfia rhizophila CBS 207.26]|uniref:Tc1-like transposase DDE domain-containing protein n=1 Tax=Zopfia rhizophila CBS 207.26 TaxID=1314779 RepID=A0A6A6ESA0_9PEZI|nr:hypothetical protein K469DRAFT_689225 [Zopfia rhizophila CBS 207.26]